MPPRKTFYGPPKGETKLNQARKLLVIDSVTDGILAGLTVKQIASRLNQTEAQVRQSLDAILLEMAEAARAKIEQWQTVAFEQSELVKSRIMRSILETPDSADLDHKLIRDFALIIQTQRDILGRFDPPTGKGGTTNIHIEQTITTGSSLYKQIMAETHGEVVEGEIAEEKLLLPIGAGADEGFAPDLPIEALQKIGQSLGVEDGDPEGIRQRFQQLYASVKIDEED